MVVASALGSAMLYALAVLMIQLSHFFTVDTTTSFFVLTRQNDLTNARVTETSALTDYRKAATELARATGVLLEERGISTAGR